MSIVRCVYALSVLCALIAAPVFAQQLESTPAPAGEHPVGYLAKGTIDFHAVLPAPPPAGSLADDLDRAAVMALQTSADAARWQTANEDAEYVYPRFDAAFGAPIDRAHAPRLVTLLNRAIRDVGSPSFEAKHAFLRLRPFQRYQLTRVCGEQTAPAPDPDAKERSSYPSGHSAYGWTTALVLAQVAPEHAGALLERARDYGLSREICGVHFPSDVEAGRVIATAVVARLLQDPQFQQDLAAARTEHAAAH